MQRVHSIETFTGSGNNNLNPARQKGAKLFFKYYISQLLAKNRSFNLHCLSEYGTNFGFAPFCHPSGLAILPNLLCCSELDVPKYAFAPRASNLGQTRQLQDLGVTKL